MGKAVKSVAKLATSPGQSILKSAGINPQQDLLDPMRGKYQVAPGYTPDEAVFQESAAQQQFTDLLRRQATEQRQGPSVAQLQLQRGTDRTRAQLAGAAAGARGPNQALAMRSALQAQGAAGQEAAGQAALLRAQEAQQDFANQQAAQAAYAADLARQQQVKLGKEDLKAGQARQTQQLQSAANLNQQQGQKDLISQVANAALMSDKNVKKNIKSADLKDLAEKIKAVTFEYKQPNGESYQDGTVTGLLAQDLEKSKLGKEMVVKSSDGKKMVDLKKAVPVTMAAVSEIIKKINKLEKKV